jgi:thiamine-monophosphate kinase
MAYWIGYLKPKEARAELKLTASEFDFIKKYFVPLTSAGAPSYSLNNDAAVFSPNPGKDLVVTKDALVADIHFFANDNPENIAQRALRSNLSDLAAMGAEPIGYLLSIALPKTGLDIDKWLKAFASGLADNQKNFRWSLWGGDTVSTTGPITISITAIGETNSGKHLVRDGARIGDGIYVSGTLGDAAVAVNILKDDLEWDDQKHFLKRYYEPMPRLKLGKQLVGIASSALDVSDGLIGDLSHICKLSGVGAEIYKNKIPLSKAFSNLLETNNDYSYLSWCGGDDYELLFTVPQEKEESFLTMFKCHKQVITRIGEITKSPNIVLNDELGNKVDVDQIGYRHFQN